MDYLLNSSMEMLDEYYQPKDTDVVISLVSTEECEQRYHSLPIIISSQGTCKITISDTAKRKCSRTVSWEPF